MSAAADNPAGGAGPVETATVVAALKVAGRRLEVTMTVPAGPVRPGELLGLSRRLSDAIVEAAGEYCREHGSPVSCGPGCGACCRQLVPVSGIEARALVELVEAMPEERRGAVRGRFAAARRRLAEAGMLEALLGAAALPVEELRPLGVAYFDLSIACPFLEEESCSIHPHRPCVCREYVVVSPPANCAGPMADGVKCVVLPGKVSVALNWLTGRSPQGFGEWAPLVLIGEWVSSHAAAPPARPGGELLRELLSRLAGRALPFPALGPPAGGKEQPA